MPDRPFRAFCIETVEPLADERGINVENHDALAEAAPLSAALALLDEATEAEVWCTHGDVVENLIGHLETDGVPDADARLGKKGSTWVLTISEGRVVGAKYLPPPVTRSRFASS